ncbi:MFS transporter [Campylobacter sp. MIT 21-1685]|uniref:MFS transporter n=1 Tax=unclassified Campylobacter TaxID=2593542 RepID=UPI00224B0471|nr:MULTISPECIES: MFS transporter [unclassified Campylobacter]MCX2683063.1 MFS transporter [Campylobacter sp. MIT 21-1684]MCX2751345.1 MFS transporter [Campylobacter sp. MIT 21-1682]MCX2807544.1 MFS transporter [Campylobacter sp. MIT 21-1685]
MQKHLSKNDVKILGLSSLGGTLEFYDFIIFVFFANFISQHFFPHDLSEFWKVLNTYGTFAAGYLARPLGGIVMAHFGDKFGRKNMFVLSILLMVLPTFLLAFLPGFESIGYAAPVLLLLIRIFQGIAIGGELPGAWVFVTEHAPENKKGIYLGVLTACVVGGILLGSVVSLIMNVLYTQEELHAWAWRVPFFLGGIFGIISLYLRRFLQETPVFKQIQQEKSIENFPLKEVLKSAKFEVFVSMLITWVLTGCVVIFILIMPNFVQSTLEISTLERIYLQMLGIVFACFGCIFSGYLSDKFGIFVICSFFAFLLGISSFCYFNVFYALKPSLQNVVIFYLMTCFSAGITNFCPLIMSGLFDTKVRFSGLSFSYNIAYAIAGGFTPQLLTILHSYALENLEHWSRFFLSFYVLFLAFIALLVACLVRKRLG